MPYFEAPWRYLRRRRQYYPYFEDDIKTSSFKQRMEDTFLFISGYRSGNSWSVGLLAPVLVVTSMLFEMQENLDNRFVRALCFVPLAILGISLIGLFVASALLTLASTLLVGIVYGLFKFIFKSEYSEWEQKKEHVQRKVDSIKVTLKRYEYSNNRVEIDPDEAKKTKTLGEVKYDYYFEKISSGHTHALFNSSHYDDICFLPTEWESEDAKPTPAENTVYVKFNRQSEDQYFTWMTADKNLHTMSRVKFEGRFNDHDWQNTSSYNYPHYALLDIMFHPQRYKCDILKIIDPDMDVESAHSGYVRFFLSSRDYGDVEIQAKDMLTLIDEANAFGVADKLEELGRLEELKSYLLEVERLRTPVSAKALITQGLFESNKQLPEVICKEIADYVETLPLPPRPPNLDF